MTRAPREAAYLKPLSRSSMSLLAFDLALGLGAGGVAAAGAELPFLATDLELFELPRWLLLRW